MSYCERWNISGPRSGESMLGRIVLSCFLVFGWSLSLADEALTGYVGPEYRIGPQDQLEISVWREEELQRTVLVRPDGGISFPLAGSMPAAGKTTRQLEQEITAKLQAFIPESTLR